MENNNTTAPGWYKRDDNTFGYWDGQQWTTPEPQKSPEEPKKKPFYKKKWFIIVAGLFLPFALIGSCGSDTETPQATSDKTVSAPEYTPAPSPSTTIKKAVKPASQIGKKVRDGKFEFVVKSVKCGIKTVGNEYLNTKAQGQFCAVTVTVKNVGDEPQFMFADNQYGFDGKERKFSADSEASIYDEDSQVLWEEINPGNSVKGKVYFDIPKGAKLTRLELHDSAFSGGVGVRL